MVPRSTRWHSCPSWERDWGQETVPRGRSRTTSSSCWESRGETKDAYIFKADVPGIPEKDIEIQMTGNVLTIAGQRKLENVQEGERFFALERGYGSFSRSFALPDGVDVEHVSAEVKDGVLTVRIPKKPEVQPRRISIGSSAPSDPAKA